MICTHPPCDAPTEQYLCHDCVTELHDHWKQIPDLVPVLTLIMRGQEKAFHQPTAEGRTGAAGSKAPINMSALSLAQNLIMARNTTPNEYAQHHDAGTWKERIEAWVNRADKMVNGEPEDKPTPDYIRYRLNQLEPLNVTQLIVWMYETTGVKINANRIYKWAERGIITRTNETGNPTYHPADVYLAWHEKQAA